RLIERQPPDLVILDMMMPRLGGLPVLEYFHGKPDSPAFLMITANDGQIHKTYAKRIGVRDYIRKPFQVKRLLEGVERCLGKAPLAEVAEAPHVENAGRAMLPCQCGACGVRMRAPLQLLGQTRPCPRCGHGVAVRPQPPA